ncbi:MULTISPECIES: CHAT domain-containing protein [Nostoc]|uniref:CHAT domain-containing protein n=1 Tax=Nostoc TaxID=1177 RepID=UPI0018EFA033|nr:MULTISPECIES: CHAT domain-containing protein [Nostoc]
MVDQYIFSGSLPENASTYVIREADAQLYEGLKAGKFCYILNSRQSGKSSLRVRTMQRLRDDGVQCAAVDLSAGGIQNVPPEQWYADLIDTLIDSFGLDLDFGDWWETNQLNSLVTRFRKFLEEVLLVEVQEDIVIFIDEIDSVLSLNFPTDDFFALIRACYNKRVDNPQYNRLTFCLLGVASPSNLIEDKQRTPFNIGKAISLKGFQLNESEPLKKGLQGKFNNPQAVMQEILQWTGGQPFLTQKLCQFMAEESTQENPRSVEQVVRLRIIESWESQDEPEHLRTIQARILRDEQRAGYLLELYQKVRVTEETSELTADDTLEQSELQLSGLVVRQQGKLRIYNYIYREIFNSNWIENQLNNLRPYSESFRFWAASGGIDKSRLLRGKALQEAEEWSRDKNLSYQDKQFLAASKEQEIQEEITAKEQEAALKREIKDKEAAEARNELLNKANKKAQRRITIGSSVLVLLLIVTYFLGIIARKEVVKARSAREQLQQSQQAQQDAERRAKETEEKTQQAQTKATLAEYRAKKATQAVQLVKQDIFSTRIKLENLQKEFKFTNQNKKVIEKSILQAKQEITLSATKLKKYEEEAKNANQNAKAAEQQFERTKQELYIANLNLEKAKQIIANVSHLSALGGELYKKNKLLEAERAWKQAAISFEIQNSALKEGMLLSSISLAYFQLNKLTEAEQAISRSLLLLKTDLKKDANPDHLFIVAQALNIKAQILTVKGENENAFMINNEAFNTLEYINDSLFNLSSPIKLYFNETVQRIYRDLLYSLLFSCEGKNLKKAHQLIESLHLTELSNFRKIYPKDINLNNIDKIDPKAALIYPIILNDRLKLIVQLPNQPLMCYSNDVLQADINTTVINFVSELKYYKNKNVGSNPKKIENSRKLYEWLIKPLEANLVRSGVKTLVFVMDGSLRKIPISALYDNEKKKYLIEKYALAQIPTIQNVEPTVYVRRPLKVLIAGISKPIKHPGSKYDYSPLPGVILETEKISSILNSQILLNENFTSTAFEKTINSSNFSVIHVASHARYSSNNEDFSIIAWDKEINSKNFKKALDSINKSKSHSIELLVLSACDTTRSEKELILGFAGLALQSNIRSIIGTLNEVDDMETSDLMFRFYKELNISGVSKAEALRTAQLASSASKTRDSFLRNSASFILIGDWR